MFCHYRRLAPATKPTGQDVFLEYRRHANDSWSGSARHPYVCYLFAICLLSVCYLFAVATLSSEKSKAR